MNPIERTKRIVVSRLTGEVDIERLTERMDGVIAILRYKNKTSIVEKSDSGSFHVYVKSNAEYNWIRQGFGLTSEEDAIEYAAKVIKNDGNW